MGEDREPSTTPTVSILMVAHNAEPTISLALSSLISQTHANWCCHIVDDASTDGTSALLSRLRDPRLAIHSSPLRLGRGGARNLALRHVRGKYLASLDADDFLFPYALESQVRALESAPSLGACTGSLLLFGAGYVVLGRRRTQIQPGRHQIGSPLTTRVPLGSTMLRRSLIGSHRFDDSLERSEDRDFFDRVLRGTTLEVLAQPTYAYRWSLSLENVMEGLRNREALFRRAFPSSPLRAGTQVAWNRVKRLCYPAFSKWGLWTALNRWRTVPPAAEEVTLFRETLEALEQVELFHSS